MTNSAPAAAAPRAVSRSPSAWNRWWRPVGATMIGVFTLAPSRLTLVSISTMSRSMRGRSFSFRHAVTFSLAVISSSAPVSQNTHDSGRITRRAFCSSASRSTQSTIIRFPCAVPSRRLMPTITEMRCPAAWCRGRLRSHHCRECSMPSARPSTADKRKTFRELHKSGCFVIPNPWNVGSARYLQGLGFKALATTSSGHAHSEGYPDGAQSMDEVLAHYRELAAATDIPLNADFENGFADDPDKVAENVTKCIATGVAGLSIEDSPQNRDAALRFRRGARARQGRARRDRQGRRRRGVHRAHRGLHPRPARHRRDHPAAQGLRRRRRRLSLLARHQDPRAHRGDREGGRRQGRSTSSTSARSASP